MKKRFIALMLSLTVMLSALMPGTSVIAEMAVIFFFCICNMHSGSNSLVFFRIFFIFKK